MAGIDNRILVQLRAEDEGFVAGIRNASRSIDEMQKRLGDLSKTKGASAIREAAEYSRGLSSAVRGATPDVERFMSALSDARKINGAVNAYKSLAQTHELLASRYAKTAKSIEAQTKSFDTTIASLKQTRAAMQSLYQIQAELLKQRQGLNRAMDALPNRTASGAPDKRFGAYKKLKADLDAVNASLTKLKQSKAFTEGIADTRKMSADLIPLKKLNQELDAVNQKIREQRKLAQGARRVGSASDSVNQAIDNEIARVRALQRAEQQREQALDSRITKARAAAEIAKRQQQAEIEAAIKLNQVQQAQKAFASASPLQKTGIFLQSFAVAASKAATVFGALTLAMNSFRGSQNLLANATSGATGKIGAFSTAVGALGQFLTRGAQQNMALNNAMTRVAVGAALVGAALSRLFGVLRVLPGLLLRLAAAFIRVGAVAARVMYGGLKLIIGLSGRFVSSMGNIVKSLFGTVAAFVASGRAQAQYRRETGQTVDAEGWHSRSMKGLVGNAVNLNRWINTLGSSIRQMGQALQNTGMTLSVFLSYPTSRVLGGMTSMVMEFDKSLIEVRKNSDLLMDSLNPEEFTLQTLKGQLLDLLQITPTQPEMIGKMAADTARLGLPSEFIAPFVQTMDQLVVATNVTADEAVDSVGRIMNIFYDLSSEGMKDVDAFMKAVTGLGSAINEVGQANPVGEKEIVAALLRMAPAASAIGMDLATAIGLSGSVASASASPERAGTQLNNALTQMAINLEDVAKASGIAFDVLTDQANKDPAETFLAIVDAIAQIPGAMDRAVVAEEFFGMVGGKAVNTLGASFDKVIENVALSRVAFEDGTSLALEFSRAMDAVSNQVGLLKNQFNVIGIALGDALLPVITQILTYVVPIMQAVAKLFQQVDNKVKLAIVGFGLLAAAIGPVLFAFGSLLFSLGIMTTGLTGLMTVLGGLTKIPLTLAGALFAIISPFMAIKVAIAGAIVYLVFFGDTINDVIGMVVSFGQNMYAWGHNMFMSFAEGIYDAAVTVVQAVYDTLSAIAAMLRSFSPPKEGPLKDIDKWGTNIATTFADAFALADLSGIVTFGNKIKSTIEQTIRGLDSFSTELFANLWSDIKSIIELLEGDLVGGLTSFINLLSVMQSGEGDIGAAFADLSSYLGSFSQDMIEIIKLQVRYNLEVENGNQIKERLENLDRDTQDRIKEIASDQNLSVAERLAGIRGVKASASREKDVLTMQLENSEKLQESLAELLNYQQQIVDIFREFFQLGQGGGSDSEDLSDKLPDKEDIEETDDALQDLALDVDGVKEKIEAATGSIKESFAGISGDAGRFITNVNAARFSIAAFIDAILGRPINKEELEVYGAAYEQAYNNGKAWRDGIVAWMDEVARRTQPIRDFLNLVGLILIAFASGFTGNSFFATVGIEAASEAYRALGDNLLTIIRLGRDFSEFIRATQEYFGYLASLFTGGGDDTPLSAIINAVKEFGVEFAKAFGEGNPAVGNLGVAFAPLKSIVDSLVLLAGLVFTNLGPIGEFMGGLAKNALMASGYLGVVLEILKSLAGFGDWENLQNNIQLTGSDWLSDLFNLDGISGDDFARNLIDLIVKWIQEADFSSVGRELGTRIQEALFGVRDLESGSFSGGLFSDITSQISPDAIAGFLQGFIQMASNVIISLNPTPLIDGLGVLLGAVFKGLSESPSLDLIGIWIGVTLTKIFAAIPVEKFSELAVSVVNGIITGFNAAVNSKALDQGLKNFANAFVSGLATIEWGVGVTALGELATKILEALGDAPWSSLSTALSDFITALLGALANPEMWNAAGVALGKIGTEIALGIIKADWATLFSAEALVNVVGAFLNGISTGIQEAFADNRDFSLKAALHGFNIAELQAKFDELESLSITNPDDLGIVQDMSTVRNLLAAAGQEADANLEVTTRLEAAYARYYEAYQKGQGIIDGSIIGIQKWLQGVVTQKTLIDGIFEEALERTEEGARKQKERIEAGNNGIDKIFENVSGWIESILGMTATPAVAAGAEVDGASSAPLNYNVPTQAESAGSTGASSAPAPSGAELVVDVSAVMQAMVNAMLAWSAENIVALQNIGIPIAQNVLIGFSRHIGETSALAFNSVTFQLGLWTSANSGGLGLLGGGIAEHVKTGIATALGAGTKYFDNISTMLARFESSIGKGHSIYKSGLSIGNKISGAIGNGVMDNWKTIADSITEAVNRAIASVRVNTAPPRSMVDDIGGGVNGASFAGVSIPWFGDNTEVKGAGQVVINFNGDVNVDSKERVKELTDMVSREIARRARVGFATR